MVILGFRSNSVSADSRFTVILCLAPYPHFLVSAPNSGPSEIGDKEQRLQRKNHILHLLLLSSSGKGLRKDTATPSKQILGLLVSLQNHF